MATRFGETIRRQNIVESKVSLILLAVALLLPGCQSAAYRARQLPAEFRTATRSDRQTIDFSRVASPGASDSVIAPRDLLKIDIATGRENEKKKPVRARVAEDGTVSVPIIGPVPVAGLEAYEASQNIANLAIQRGMYRNPYITVEIESKAVNRITVLGAVSEPGVHELPRGNSDLVSAIAASGGLTDEAGTEIEIVRQSAVGLASNENKATVPATNESGEIQLAAYQGLRPHAAPQAVVGGYASGHAAPTTIRLDLSSGRPMGNTDFRLNDRDVVRIVPKKKETIYVSGLVRRPGDFELPTDQDVHLLDAIALAGGRSSPVADKVYVIRRMENRPEPIVIQVSLSEAKQNGLENLRIAAGDTITVEQTPATAVVDAVKQFFRLSFGVASRTTF
ncbi:MAG: hypothetical protein GXP26_14900 [Planctomycetes bacterium]|nr:hypothetical protein [Planctomycetota bacterium]